MDNNIRNAKRTSLHHRPTEERARTGGGLNDGRKHIITFNDSGYIHWGCGIHSLNGLDR